MSDNRDLKEAIRRFGDLGEELFNTLYDRAYDIADEIGIKDEAVTQGMAEFVAKSIMASVVLTGIASVKKMDPKETDKLGDSISEDLQEVARRHHIENGASILTINIDRKGEGNAP